MGAQPTRALQLMTPTTDSGRLTLRGACGSLWRLATGVWLSLHAILGPTKTLKPPPEMSQGRQVHHDRLGWSVAWLINSRF